MRIKSNHYLFIGMLVSVTCYACIKNNVKDLGSAGSVFIKLGEAPLFAQFLEPFSGTKPIPAFSIRKDVPSNEELNRTVTVTLKLDTAALRVYNQTHQESFELLPDSLYTLGAGIVKTADLTYQVKLEGGAFAKDFIINLNGSKWDLAHKYALPFLIQDPGGLKITSGQENIISLISVKNAYDGRYRIKGVLNGHPSVSGPYNDTRYACGSFSLVTSGANTVELYDGHPYGVAGSGGTEIGWFAVYPGFAIDPATLKVTAYDAGGTVASIENFSDYDSRYDPASKTIYVKFGWNGSRVVIDTLTYCGAR